METIRWKSVDDLLHALNSSSEFNSNNISLRQVSYYAYHKKDRYHTFTVPKSDGSQRTIKAPDQFLKQIQRKINILLQDQFIPQKSAYGFVKGRSIKDHAKNHKNKKYLYSLDLRDYFPSVSVGRVLAILQLKPFYMDKQVALMVANLCCDNGVLPQGAPTSPVLANLISQRLDRKLVQLSARNRMFYSRYADDLTFSSNNLISDQLKTEIIRIIQEEGFEINPKKERVQESKQRQVVTGLIVNKKVNVPRSYLKNIRAILNNWEVDGIDSARANFCKKNQIENISKRKFSLITGGKIDFIGQIRGKSDFIYLKYALQHALLTNNSKKLISLLTHAVHVNGIEKCLLEINVKKFNVTSMSDFDLLKSL